ncbi:PLP-dependent aminotransferase family protein [Ilumatobacter sp.]|uniref:aminotransferase-like domain-containing protein n=1 Tax=Ilumatobacter sp. TaxID=1967498 RepID=UPI003B518DD1
MSYTFARRTDGLRSSAIRDLLKLTEVDDMLSLAGGLPAPDSFPLLDLRRAADRLLGEHGPRAVQYSATDGVVELRGWLAGEYSAALGREIAVEGQIVVTHGSQQALDLLAKVLVDPGDVVVTESPAYLGAVQAIELFQPRFEVVPGDEHGMRVDVLADRLAAGLRPRFVYVVPNFHNPSGATMSLDRRRLLAELADRFEVLIVEDDPYGAIRFSDDPLPPVASFTERAVHLSTFSKIVAPGFRVGWMIGPPEVMGWVARAKQAADLHTSTFAQLVLTDLVATPGWLDEQRARIVPIYRDRCVALADALDAGLGERISFHRPNGGMFLWTEFAELDDTTRLLSLALDRGVAFVPGNAFTIDQEPDPHARFSYATVPAERMGDAVERLVGAVDRAVRATG